MPWSCPAVCASSLLEQRICSVKQSISHPKMLPDRPGRFCLQYTIDGGNCKWTDRACSALGAQWRGSGGELSARRRALCCRGERPCTEAPAIGRLQTQEERFPSSYFKIPAICMDAPQNIVFAAFKRRRLPQVCGRLLFPKPMGICRNFCRLGSCKAPWDAAPRGRICTLPTAFPFYRGPPPCGECPFS